MSSLERLADADAVFKIGRVIAVEGRQVRVAVDKLKNGSHLLFRGDLLRNVSAGGYIKITKGFSEIIAKVDGEHVAEDRSATGSYARNADRVARVLDVSLIGFLTADGFERGVRELPLLDNEAYLLNEDEFGRVHQFVGAKDVPLPIGALAMEPSQRVEIGVDAIFASHVGIFGNTGSGKSYTLAKLYTELFKQFAGQKAFGKQARFVLVDFNGEYVDRKPSADDVRSTAVITDAAYKDEYVLSTRTDKGSRIPITSEAAKDPALWTVLLDASEKTQAPFLSRVLSNSYWESKLQDPADLTSIIGDLVLRATKSGDRSMDKHIVLNFLREIQTCLGAGAPSELEELIRTFQAKLNYNGTLSKYYWDDWSKGIYVEHPDWEKYTKGSVTAVPFNFSGVKDLDLVRFKIVLQYYSDIISGFSNREHLGPLIKRLETRVPDIKKVVTIEDDKKLTDKPLAVVCLRDVNLDMRKVIPMLLCKQLYDQKKASDQQNETYLNLIIDEAHNILSEQSSRESEAWRDYRLETFEEIIKEGRKFGVFLTISSQRPHDISETIISQLHNYFLHRLINNLDINAVQRAVSYLDKVSFEQLSILPTGTCITAGVSAQVPVVVKVDPLPEEREPNSRTMRVAASWRG